MLFIRQASVRKSILSSVKKSIYCPIRGQKKKTGGLTKSINSTNTWGIKFKLIKQF